MCLCVCQNEYDHLSQDMTGIVPRGLSTGRWLVTWSRPGGGSLPFSRYFVSLSFSSKVRFFLGFLDLHVAILALEISYTEDSAAVNLCHMHLRRVNNYIMEGWAT